MQPLRLRKRLRRHRDLLAGLALFGATAATILWQNAHLCVLWDFSYVLDSAARMALGQVPYRDFPFVHPPMPFLIQAAILRLAGRIYWHHAVYCALAGGLGTAVTWRILWHTLRGKVRHDWATSVLLAAPLAVVGVYCILPHPSYDCDTALAILVALYLWQRLAQGRTRSLAGCFGAGAALAVPLFFKQNMGLPLLAAGAAVLVVLLGLRWRRGKSAEEALNARQLAAILAGAAALVALGLLALQLWAGLGNYYQWTIRFAGQRRMPGLGAMLGIYQQPWLLWMLPSMAAGLCLARLARQPVDVEPKWTSNNVPDKWTNQSIHFSIHLGAFLLLAAPFLWTLATPFVYPDADDRADALLALWPLMLLLAAGMVWARLFRAVTLRAFLPLLVLAAIHGTLMSQQLWGSTYAIWPLWMVLVAELFADAAPSREPGSAARSLLPLGIAATVSVTLLVCGGLYTASEERLSYIDLPGGPVRHSDFPALEGASVTGDYLADFDQLLRFVGTNIPAGDGLLLLPGEDPFYFATGRLPRFPVLLFDRATDPYSPAELVAEARARKIRWLVVKRKLQIKADPTPEREALLTILAREFRPVAKLNAYDIYVVKSPTPLRTGPEPAP